MKHPFIESQVLSRLSALTLHPRIPVLGNVAGKHRSPIRGSSLEFAAYRKYVPGDDTRRLDWRAWGRSDRFYIKEFEADTNLRMCLIVDTSGSMNFAGPQMTKLEYARHLAGTLAYMAARQGDAVGLYCAGKTFSKEIPPKRNTVHLRTVLDELGTVQAAGETGMADALHEAAERVPQRALIIIISDLFVPPDTLRSCFQHLKFRKHDVAVFHLLEQNEIDFRFDRPVRFLDMEGGAPVLAEPTLIARKYHEALQTYLAGITQVTRDAMVDYHRVLIHEPYGDVLARFLLSRMPKGARK
ncbi:MAG: DUF58 domain-containing protein [Pirellulaceae bacterium]|nr:DUF58 domain-containing protein [Planctomycetales bacterium]MCA9266691.1 DUF58 domain-containing protein [Planctomycetales bacterium]